MSAPGLLVNATQQAFRKADVKADRSGFQAVNVYIHHHPETTLIVTVIHQVVQRGRRGKLHVFVFAVKLNGLLDFSRQLLPLVGSGKTAGEVQAIRLKCGWPER